MALSVRSMFPTRVIVGNEDITDYLTSATFSNVDQGGFEAFSCELPRDIPNIIRGTPILVTTGLATAWMGRVEQCQRSLGPKTTITGAGYANLLKDNDLSFIGVDRDFSRWVQPSVQRQINSASSFNIQTGQVAPDSTSGSPSIAQSMSAPWSASPQTPLVENWYDAGPQNRIGSVYYAWKINGNVSPADTNWNWDANLTADDVASGSVGSGNQRSPGPGSGTVATSGAAKRFANIQLFYNTAAVTGSLQYAIYWTALRVAGDHGLPLRGAEPAGLYPSDIAKYAAQQAPGLALGVCPDMTGYTVPHYVQYVPVGLDQIVGDMGTIAGWHWGVWEPSNGLVGSQTPRFDFRPRPQSGTFTASCLRRDCDSLDIREDLTQLYNSATVTWTDAAGVQQATTVTVDNPQLDQAGINRTVVLNGGTLGSSAVATVFGQEALTLLATQARVAGSIQVSSPLDSVSGRMAPWLLKAGLDRLRIGDAPTTDAWGSMNDYPISRVEVSVSEQGANTSIELGSGANLVESLNARLAAATVLAGSGSGG